MKIKKIAAVPVTDVGLENAAKMLDIWGATDLAAELRSFSGKDIEKNPQAQILLSNLISNNDLRLDLPWAQPQTWNALRVTLTQTLPQTMPSDDQTYNVMEMRSRQGIQGIQQFDNKALPTQ
jgi:hypothetical protein